MRVNLIRSILVFREKKYCLHDNAKLVFLKKKYKNYTHWKKKNTRTVQVNCTVHATTKFLKAARSCFAKFACKTLIGIAPPKLNSIFDITKHHVCCGCFKRRSNHANKRPLKKLAHRIGERNWLVNLPSPLENLLTPCLRL